jgi:hypothetical protein
MTDQSPVFTAVQEDATSFCMDWPVFQGNGSAERQFRGAVFVLDCGGIRVSDTPMTRRSTRSVGSAAAIGSATDSVGSPRR